MGIGGGGGGGGSRASAEERALYAEQAKIAREQWDTYKSTVLPAQKALIEESQAPITEGQYAAAAGRASADVDASFDNVTRRYRNELSRYGVNPASGRYAGGLRQLALGRAASRAGAMTGSRRALTDRRDRLRYASVGLSSGLGSSAMRGLSDAASGYGSIANRAAQSRSSRNSTWGNLLGTAATAAAFAWSDRRVKTDVRQVGTLFNGVPVYTFRMVWGSVVRMGVMADEVHPKCPELVHRNGFMKVDYGGLADAMVSAVAFEIPGRWRPVMGSNYG